MELTVPRKSPHWFRWVINTNPFYLISVGLLLYGIHVSFADTAKVGIDWPWMLMKILAGYTLALAMIGVLIIKAVQVWDDARSILLLVVLLLIALASSFDRVCLDDARQSSALLISGWVFAVTLCEVVVYLLRLRFTVLFRLALYLQLALLFIYPVLLGLCSLTNRDAEMLVGVVVFPAFAAVFLLAAIPSAVLARERGYCPSAWKWPVYPYSATVVMTVGMSLRSVGFSYSFELAAGMSSGFLWCFLVPIAAAVVVLGLELARHVATVRLATWVALLPAVPILFAFAPQSLSIPQWQALARFQQLFGAPIQVAILLAAMTYLRWWAAGFRSASWGFLVVVGLATIVDQDTTNWQTLTGIQHGPWWFLVVVLALRAWRLDDALWMTVAVTMAITDVYVLAQAHGRSVIHDYLFVNGLSVTLLTVPRGYGGPLGRWARRHGTQLAFGMGLLGAVAYPLVFGRVNVGLHLVWITLMSAFCAYCWWRTRDVGALVRAVMCGGVGLAYGFVCGLVVLHRATGLSGRDGLMGAVLVLTIALVLSLIKGGICRRLMKMLIRTNRCLFNEL